MSGAARRRPCSTTSSSRTSTGCSRRTSRCSGRSRSGYPDDAHVLGLELRAPRRPRPARGAGDRPRNDAERLPAARARGSTSTPARRSRAAGRRSRGRRRSRSSRSMRAPGAVVPVQPAHGVRLVVGGGRADASRARRLPRDERRPARPDGPAARRPDLRPGRLAARPGDDRRARPSPGAGTSGRCPAWSSGCTGRACRARSPSPGVARIQFPL